MAYGLDWANELYVRFYTKDNAAWNLLGFEGQVVYMGLKRKLDRAGTLGCAGEVPAEAVAAVLPGWPVDLVVRGAQRLIDRGWLIYNDEQDLLVDPEHLEAEEASKTNRLRCAESRLRRREIASAQKKGVISKDESSIYGNASDATQNASKTTRLDAPTLPLPTLAVQGKSAQQVSIEEDFAAWWSILPRKVGKKAARSEFIRLRAAGKLPSIGELCEVTREHERVFGWKGDQFTPHPRTWLYQERFAESLEGVIPVDAKGTGRNVTALAGEEDRRDRRRRRRVNE